MISARGTFCQKIQCQEWCSVYHPSREAEMFRDSSRLRAYTAMPNAQYFGGMFSNTKLKVSGMKKPEASPPRSCMARKVGKVSQNGVNNDTNANKREVQINTLRAPKAPNMQAARRVTNIWATVCAVVIQAPSSNPAP